MSLKILKYTCLLTLAFGRLISQDSQEMYTDKWFLIISSTKSLENAYITAKTASEKTNLLFKDSKLKVDTSGFANVTFPVDSCELFGFEYPCYVPRGRGDDGSYITIESSNGFQGFTPDLFIIIAASGLKQDQSLHETLDKVKKYYPDSYIKQAKVYMGCLH